MKRISIYLCLISALLLFGAGETAPGQEAKTDDVSNPFVGTWVLNLDKSSNDLPIPIKSDTVISEAQDNGLKITLDRVRTDGIKIHLEASPKFDGKDYPVIGSPDRTQSLKRINTNSLERVWKAYGEEKYRIVEVVSEDGMTRTVTLKEKNSEGQEVAWILVYDKQ